MIILAHTVPNPYAGYAGPDIRVRLVLRNDDIARLGSLVWHRRDGWRFYPEYPAKPSRKDWPTASQALKSYGIQLTGAPQAPKDALGV